MRNLEAFSQRTDFINFRGQIGEFSIIQGILLDYHPYWVRLWNTRERTGTGSAERAWPWLGPWEHPPFVPPREYDPEWRPDAWRRFLAETGRKDNLPPIYVILSIRPPGGSPEERRSAFAQRRALQAIFPNYEFIIEMEDRPSASLLAATSVKGGSTVASGTLGGVLQDTNIGGEHYGLTCGHVVSSGHTYNFTDSNGVVSTMTGACTTPLHFEPQPNNPGSVCNPGISNCVVNEVDIAFLRLSAKETGTEVDGIGQITGVARKTDMSVRQTIEMHGKASGHKTYRVGALAVAYELGWNNNSYCYENMFEVRCIPWSNVAAPIQRAALNPPQAGDSGAWICVPTTAGCADFAGVLVGGDLLMGYAIFTDIVTTTAGNSGLTLRWI